MNAAEHLRERGGSRVVDSVGGRPRDAASTHDAGSASGSSSVAQQARRARVAGLGAVGDQLKKSALARRLRDSAVSWFRAGLFNVSPTLLAMYTFYEAWGRLPNFHNPTTFDEKLQWLMLYWRHPLKTICADKYAVRAYVEEHGFGRALPELLGVYEDPNLIELHALPERFALKCTHASGFNVICTDRTKLNWPASRRMLTRWLRKDISKVCGEIHYSSIPPRIVCEEYLEDGTGGPPIDYKVYCFSGIAHCTMTCLDRRVGARTKFVFCDRDWHRFLPYNQTSVRATSTLPRPAAYDEMIAIAEELSKPFPFVRVDFYDIRGKAVFGEMTFTPNGCVDPGYTEVAERDLGRLITLPPKLL